MFCRFRIDLVYKYLEENKMTKNEFCDSIKISKKSLNKFLNNNLDFEVESLIKIANLLKISAYDLLTLIE